jgi:hypothetical protein
MDETTPHCHAESFAAFVERERQAQRESLQASEEDEEE